MDARRIEDGIAVCLKAVYRTPKESEISKYFSLPKLLQEPTNHSVPILDVFRDPSAPDFEYLVMPLLRPFDDPQFGVIGEVVDFVTQILEVCSVLDLPLHWKSRFSTGSSIYAFS